MTVNEEIRDRAIRHAIAIRRYDAGLTQKILNLLNSSDEDLVAKIAARLSAIDERGLTLSASATKRLQTLLDEVRAINAAAYSQVNDTLSDELVGLSGVEAEYQATALTASLPVKIGIGVPSPARLATIVETSPIGGSILSTWVEGLATDRAALMEQAIRKGLVTGASTDEIVRSIRGTAKAKYQDGILKIGRQKAQTLVRTAITHTTNAAAMETWKKNDHVVKERMFVATLDSRTSITCAAMDGKTFPLDSGVFPPLHPNCRSITIPITKTWREMGFTIDELTDRQRASMDGQVPASTTFSKWLKDKGEDTQNKVLGPTRAQLFRSGKLDLESFIKSDGTVLTLDQLRKANELAD